MPTFMFTSPFLAELGQNRAGAFFSALSYFPVRALRSTIPQVLNTDPPEPVVLNLAGDHERADFVVLRQSVDFVR